MSASQSRLWDKGLSFLICAPCTKRAEKRAQGTEEGKEIYTQDGQRERHLLEVHHVAYLPWMHYSINCVSQGTGCKHL